MSKRIAISTQQSSGLQVFNSSYNNNNNTQDKTTKDTSNKIIMLVNKAALCSILLSAASTILPGVQVQAQEYEISSDGTIIEPPEPISEVNVGPIEHKSDPSRIIAAFASEEGLAELEAHVAEEKKNGRSISMGKARTFTKLRKAGGRGAGGRGGGAAGAAAGGGGGGGKNGRGGSSGGGGGSKGKGRYLQETDDIPPALGFAVIETTSDFTEEEYAKLETMPGVAFVESDVEVYINDYESLGLRGGTGGAREHVRSIMESMVMEMVRESYMFY